MSTIDPGRPGVHLDEPLADEEVVRRIRAGESTLFEILVRRYNPRLFRVARAILRDDAEAEDVMQQAYVNAFVHLDQFAERARFGTWLTRIAVHEALARLRRRARRRGVDAMSQPGDADVSMFRSKGPDPEQAALAVELRRLLEAAIDSLPRRYRSAFVLREIEGLSTAETAECLEISEETVKTRLHRARLLLREQLYDRAGLVSAHVFSLHLSRCDRVVAGVFERLALRPASGVH
jgi:RNA polymerase sigma-70 factor (ECF subfamily)